jgi:hypothetical protein
VLTRYVGMAVEQQMHTVGLSAPDVERRMGWDAGTTRLVIDGEIEISWPDLFNLVDLLGLDVRLFFEQLSVSRSLLIARQARLAEVKTE